jgi:hypothetical protein
MKKNVTLFFRSVIRSSVRFVRIFFQISKIIPVCVGVEPTNFLTENFGGAVEFAQILRWISEWKLYYMEIYFWKMLPESCFTAGAGGRGVPDLPWSRHHCQASLEVPTYQCWGCVTFWCGSGSADPYLWLTDPDLDQTPDPLNTFTREGINLVSDPYLLTTDPDPGGPKTFWIRFPYTGTSTYHFIEFFSVVDRHRFDADPYSNPNFNFDADPETVQDWHINNADQHSDPTPKFYTCWKILNFCYTFSHNIASYNDLSFSSVSKVS